MNERQLMSLLNAEAKRAEARAEEFSRQVAAQDHSHEANGCRATVTGHGEVIDLDIDGQPELADIILSVVRRAQEKAAERQRALGARYGLDVSR